MGAIRERIPPLRGEGSERWATWLFTAYLVAAVPLVLFHFGAYHWFFRDDFVFLADRRDLRGDLFGAYGGAHWVTLPRLIYLTMWQVFGMRSYVPYQAMVVALHVAACALLRLVMLRAGVRNWLASSAAATLVLFGPGSQNIVWAFQISFVGSLTYGLAQLLLSDHEGKADWRDALGVAFGLAALLSSGVGVTMAAIVGVSVFVRRGWKLALLHVAPLAVAWVLWAAQAHPKTGGPLGRPPIGTLGRWVWQTQVGSFEALGHWSPIGWLLLGVIAAGVVVIWGPWRSEGRLEALRRTATPLALFGGGILFATTSGIGRWWTIDTGGATASRYLYLGVAMSLPLLGVAAQALAERWKPLTPVFVAAFLLLIPFNLQGFEPGPPFGKDYMEQREYLLTTAVRMPFAGGVPASVQPVPDIYASDQVNMGFLRTALANGKLRPSTVELTPEVVNEFRVRLGLSEGPATSFPPSCTPVGRSLAVDLREGDRFVLTDSANVATRQGKRPTSGPVQLLPKQNGAEFRAELPTLELIIAPTRASKDLRYCPYPRK